jgi:hypothetical protein
VFFLCSNLKESRIPKKLPAKKLHKFIHENQIPFIPGCIHMVVFTIMGFARAHSCMSPHDDKS